MFQNWGFLLGEIWGLIALAAVLGLFAGWLIWGRRPVEIVTDTAEADQLRRALGECESKSRSMTSRITTLERDLKETQIRLAAAPPAPAPVTAPVAALKSPSRPASLSAPRDGRADDLRLIKGVGPKLAALLHSLGYYHFDQIAAWTPSEIAWVDENLEGFKGRMIREEWVEQARALAAGAPPRPGGEH